MLSRLPFAVPRSIQAVLRSKHFPINRSTSTFACKFNTIPVLSCQSYAINNGNHSIEFNRNRFKEYCTDSTQMVIPVVSYEEVKDLPNHPEKTLIDVREPSELQETGTIPTSINIPLGEVNTVLSLSEKQFKTKYKRSKPDLDDVIIFHCKSGMRSENAAIAATKLGYTNVFNYKGSWLDWADREGLSK